jgi:hypothetical protein
MGYEVKDPEVSRASVTPSEPAYISANSLQSVRAVQGGSIHLRKRSFVLIARAEFFNLKSEESNLHHLVPPGSEPHRPTERSDVWKMANDHCLSVAVQYILLSIAYD